MSSKKPSPNLVGKFLVAMPGLRDPHFFRTVVFMCAHSQEGSLGLVINRPHAASLKDILGQLHVPWHRVGSPLVYNGGPVAPERGFILYEHNLDIPGYLQVLPDLYMGTSPELLRRMAEAEGEERFLLALGYAGWGDGQLDIELKQNAWLVAEMDRRILFDLPPQERWPTAIRMLGINLANLVATAPSSIN